MKRRDFLKCIYKTPIVTGLTPFLLNAQVKSDSISVPSVKLALDVPLKVSGANQAGPDYAGDFSRNSSAMVINHCHTYVETKPNELRFGGARRVQNLVPRSEDFSNYSGASGFLITTNTLDPKNGKKATTIRSLRANQPLELRAAAIESHSYVNAIYVRRRRGKGNVSLLDPSTKHWRPVRPSYEWQRYSLGPTVTDGTLGIGIKLGVSGDEVDIAFSQIEDVTAVDASEQKISEYVSTGILSFPYHGAFVDGVKYFDKKNGSEIDSSSHVVTERTSSPIPGPGLKGALIEGPRTNACTNSNLKPTSLVGVTATGGELGLYDDSRVLFSAVNLNPYSVSMHPELRAVANGKVYRLKNNTNMLQTVKINGWVNNGTCSAFLWARSTSPAAVLRLGKDASIKIDGTNSHNNNDNEYAKFSLENVRVSSATQIEIDVPVGEVVYFIGNQLEAGEFSSSLIEVSGEMNTRQGDVLRYKLPGNFARRKGTLIMEWESPYSSEEISASGDMVLINSTPLENDGLRITCKSVNAFSALYGKSLDTGSKQGNTFLGRAVIGFTWKEGVWQQTFVNGRTKGKTPLSRRLLIGDYLTLGSSEGKKFAFGYYKDLVITGEQISEYRMINDIMVVHKARVIFDDKGIMDFYKSRTACDEYVAKIKAAGFNVVMPLVWVGNGTRYINDLKLPLDYTVAAGFRAGFDGMSYLIKRCHEEGIEVHPVFNVTRHGWSKSMTPYDHMYYDDPRSKDKNSNNYYNIHMPKFREWIAGIILDFVKNYKVDGLCFDYLREGAGFYTSSFNVADYRTRFGRNLKLDIAKGINAKGVMLRQWNKEDIEDILRSIVTGARVLRPGIIITNAGLGQCFPIGGAGTIQDQGQYNIDWVNSGLVDYILPWDYAHPIPDTDWKYKSKLNDPRKGTVMGGLYHGKNPIEPVLLHSIMPDILDDDGDMAALYPFWTMDEEISNILRRQYYYLPARIPWRS